MTLVQMSLSWFMECTAALRWQIATVSDQASKQSLPDKKVQLPDGDWSELTHVMCHCCIPSSIQP